MRLWDDEAFYREQSSKALEHAERWHPDRLRPLYVDFFRNAHVQAAPRSWRGPKRLRAQSEWPARSDRLEFVQVEPTTRCNLNCCFCAGRHLPQRDMTLDAFEHVLRSSPAIAHIRLQGEGEPLVHPRFFEMAEMARARHAAVRFSTITNGNLLSANADRIVDVRLQHVFVSIDTANPQLFHELRGGDLDRVVEGIWALLAARASRKADRPAIGFAVTVLRRTMGELPAIVCLYERLALDGGIAVQPLQDIPAYTRNYDEQISKQLLAAADIADMNRLIMQDARALAVLQRHHVWPVFSRNSSPTVRPDPRRARGWRKGFMSPRMGRRSRAASRRIRIATALVSLAGPAPRRSWHGAESGPSSFGAGFCRPVVSGARLPQTSSVVRVGFIAMGRMGEWAKRPTIVRSLAPNKMATGLLQSG